MQKIVVRVLYGVGIGCVVYHLIYTVYSLQSGQEHIISHLGLALTLIFLAALKGHPKEWPLLIPLLLLSLVPTIYMKAFYPQLQMRIGFATTGDMVIGIMLLVAVLEATRRTLGLVLPVIAVVFVAYSLLGYHIPSGPLRISEIDLPYLVSALVTSFGGVYGLLMEVSAYYIFLFIVFGRAVQLTGAPQFFAIVGAWAARVLKGGPAMMAITGSALFGTVSGSSSANIIVTGSFTIPLMKRAGFRPREAAAIEAAASNGGQIMPPLMGAVAFVMAKLLAMPYVTIMIAAFIPAVLYFISAGFYAQLVAMKRNLAPTEILIEGLGERADLGLILVSAVSFLVPLTLIVLLLLSGFTPLYASFWALLICIPLSFLRRGKRPSFKEWIEGLTDGAVSGAIIAASMATVGILLKVVTLTGMGVKLPAMVELWSHGNLAIALLIVAGVCTILGMGGASTSGTYILVAITAAPVIVKLGVPLLAAHMFVLYFAVMAIITPPVAEGVVIACRIAGSSYMETAVESTKVAIVGFLVPFIFISSPIFLLQPGGELGWNLTTILAGLLLIFSAQVGFVGYFLTRVTLIERIGFLLCALGLFLYITVWHTYTLLGVALLLFGLLTYIQRRRHLSRLRDQHFGAVPGSVH